MKGLNPIVFGPSTWKLFEEIPWFFESDILNSEEIRRVEQFFNLSARCLPCLSCRMDATELFELTGYDSMRLKCEWTTGVEKSNCGMPMRALIIQWVIDRHNDVNIKLGKPRFISNRDNTLKNHRHWLNSLCITLICMSYIISQTDKGEDDYKSIEAYQQLITIVLPDILKSKKPLAEIWNKLNLFFPKSPAKYFDWTLILCSVLDPSFLDLEYILAYLKVFTSNGDCRSIVRGPAHPGYGTIFQGCQ
jgi:hypothetical protein